MWFGLVWCVCVVEEGCEWCGLVGVFVEVGGGGVVGVGGFWW